MNRPPSFVRSWGTRPTLLCLHGLGGGEHFFSGLGPMLADRWRVAAVAPGSGFDPTLVPFSFDDSASSIVEWMWRDGGGRSCLLGHSLGTIVALEVIRRAPELVSGLIALGGLPGSTARRSGHPRRGSRDCGHLPFLERPDTCAAVVGRTLEEWNVAITRR